MRIILIPIFITSLLLTGCAPKITNTGSVQPEESKLETVNKELGSKKAYFKEFTWDTSVDDVKAEESLDLLTNQDNLLRYESSLLDYNAELVYIFDDGKLNEAIYTIYKNPRDLKHYSKVDEMRALEELKNELIKLYGEPDGRTPKGETSYSIHSWYGLPDTEISLLYMHNKLSINFTKKEEPNNSTRKEVEESKQNQQYEEIDDQEEISDSVISFIDGKIYINGVTLGMSSEEVLGVLGEPLFNGKDPEGISDAITEYDDLYISYYNDSSTRIIYNGLLNLKQTLSEYSGPKYKSNDPLYFLYSPEGHMIVKITPSGDTFTTYLVYEDPNFLESVKYGAYTKID